MDDGKPSEIAEKIIEQVKSTVLKEFLQSHPLTFEVKGKGKDRAEQERERVQSQQSRQTQLLEEYLQAVEEVKRARKLAVEEKLRRLISPLKGTARPPFSCLSAISPIRGRYLHRLRKRA